MLALSFIFAMTVILSTRYCPGTGNRNVCVNDDDDDDDNSKKYENCVDINVLESDCLLAGFFFFFCGRLGLQFTTFSSVFERNFVNLNS